MMSECVFCQISAGKLPAAVVYEDDKALVILDLFPVTQGHALVVPRQHCASIQALPAENTEHLLHLVRLTMAAQEQEDATRSEEHTSELQSRFELVCRLLLEKKKDYNHK